MGCLLAILLTPTLSAQAEEINEAWIKAHYVKREVRIPMRDGVLLFTAIYEPADSGKQSPILMLRTPYKAAPYGKGMNARLWKEWKEYARKGYIFVLQDVRGRWKSEGNFVHVRPFLPHKQTPADIDEASDVYDTAEWLLHHLKHTNRRIALIGSSYSGFYAWMGALSGHPAIKAVVPQAPVGDWFMGDDYHHNGALMLTDAFRFTASMNRPRPVPTENQPAARPYYLTDEYSFFLQAGCLQNLTRMLGDSIAFWKDVMNHPNYDTWWQERVSWKFCRDVKPAVLVVGGTFDAEDCYGTWNLYKTLHRESPSTPLQIAVGPWYHGAWNGNDGSYLGNIRFGGKTVPHYREEIEMPFLARYLEETQASLEACPASVEVFFSGSNHWRKFDTWPPAEAQPVSFYLQAGGKLTHQPPTRKASRSSYVSDPLHPVPYTAETIHSRKKEYMTEDQRFAARRPDVLSFQSEPLTADMTLAGEIEVELQASISTTDADFVVKVIDVFPDDFHYTTEAEGAAGSKTDYLMNGYQMLVRGDVMRGRYRNGFTHPVPFTPGKKETIRFVMPDIAHTFKRGHRIAIQVQSSWFPLVDRNPQQCIDIYHCKESDFVPSVIHIYHQQDAPSRLIFHQLPHHL